MFSDHTLIQCDCIQAFYYCNFKHNLQGICLDLTHCVCFFPNLYINPLHAELNRICPLLTLLGVDPILHISRIRVNYYFLLI